MARRTLGLLGLLLAAVSPRPAAGQLRPVQVPISGRAGIDSLAALGFEVADVRSVDGALVAVIVVAPRDAARLLAHGFAASPVARAGALAAAADTYRVFRSFEKPGTGIRATLEAWAAADTLIHLDSIGSSVEGRPILAVKIGDAADSPARPNVLFMATHHAREWISTELAMRLIRWLADSLSPPLRDARDIWVIPVENPDGYQYTFTTDRYWRKNRRANADGTYGVDPNRNYPAFWGVDNVGSSPQPGAEIYRGTAPGSEPETQVIMAFHAAHPPVLSVSYHSYSGLVLHSWGFRSGEIAADRPVFAALAGTDLMPAVWDSLPESVLAYYHPGPTWNLYPVNGEYTDWAYQSYGTIAFTPELTSGCCVAGLYYGFAFPDDSALVERVFRDNLPFALSVIAAAGDPTTAPGASGLVPAPPRLESLSPEAWINLDAAAPQPVSLTVRTGTGGTVTRNAMGSALWRGRFRNWWRSDLHTDTVRAITVNGSGLAAELVSLAGAENVDVGWTGWTRSVEAVLGRYSWTTNASDTLTSPALDLGTRSRVWLQFWTKHAGSTFTPEQRGVVQFSADGGATWSDEAAIIGAGQNWYPVRIDLPAASGARAARVRFVSRGFTWWIDAVGFATDATVAFQSLAVVGSAQLSENPVRGTEVFISWPAAAGSSRIGIYSFAGQRLVSATVPAGQNEYRWDLTIGGRRAPNGAYIVVVESGGQMFRHRLFVTRPPP
jgi:zinc carboxypeptidase